MTPIRTILAAPGAELPLCDDRVLKLYRHWLSIRPSRDLLPGRQHLEPTEIPSLLRLIWLADIARNPTRFRYRLVGTAHVEAASSDPTGRWYDEVHPRFRDSNAYPHFLAVAEEAKIAFYRGPPVYVVDTDWKTIERLILPLATNGRDVDKLLGITVLDPRLTDPATECIPAIAKKKEG